MSRSRHLVSLVSAVGLAALSPACLLSGLGGDGGALSEELEPLRSCGDDDQIEETTEISLAYAESLHEMVACGGLAVALCNGVVSGIINAILESRTDATPESWSYEAGGTYRTEGEGVVMTTQFFLAEDFEFGRSGDLVTDNVFDTENYLVGAAVNVDLSTGRTTLSYDSTGPLVELLGYGAEPPNPIELSINDLETLDDKLAALEFEADVDVDDVRDNGTVRYHVVTPRLAASALLGGAGMTYELVEADGERSETGQSLVVDEWTVVFVDENPGALDGSSRYHVTGGAFEYDAVATFERSTVAETTYSCR